MPDALDDTTGTVAFVYNRENGDPWHRKGTPADGAMTADELFVKCPALDFPVSKEPTYFLLPDGTPSEVVDWRTVVRTDTMSPLGMVRPSYSLFANREGAYFGEAVISEVTEGGYDFALPSFDTAGSLWGGRVVFFQLILGEDFRVPGDDSVFQRRLLISLGHDGRHALKAKRTNTRVVCANTHGEAMAGVGSEFTVRHTSNMEVAVAEAKKALQMVRAHDDAFEATMVGLTTQKLTLADVTAFTEALFPVNPEVEKPYRTEAARALVSQLYSGSPNLDGVPQTAYRLFQATVEYADHFRAYRTKGADAEDARAMALLDGTGSALKTRALALLS
jgi:phage/plasmid-like protein (TIGR03299 family)